MKEIILSEVDLREVEIRVREEVGKKLELFYHFFITFLSNGCQLILRLYVKSNQKGI